MSRLLVGREAEQAQLAAWLADSGRGQPRFALVEGEAGIGKTTLVDALAAHARAAGRPVLQAIGLEDAGVPPYWMWRQLVDLDPSGERFAFFEALAARLGRDSGLLVLIDDIQWVDEPSLLALRHVLRQPDAAGLHVCATRRRGDAGPGWEAVGPDLLSGPDVHRLALDGLDDTAAAEMLVRVSGAALPPDIVARAVADSGGNPLFLRELGRLLASGEAVASGQGPADGPGGDISDIIHARVRRLTPKTQQLLRTASVLAEEWELPVVARILGEPAAACLAGADESVSAGLVTTATGGRFRFSHGLVRSVLAAHIPLQESVTLHLRAAEAIEDLHRDSLAPALADIARHWAAVAVTGERRPAVDWARRAAEEAMRGLAYEEAVRLYGMSLDCGGTTLPDAERAQLLVARAGAQLAAGALTGAYDDCRQAAVLARQADRADVLAEVALCLDAIGDRRWDRSVAQWCREALDRVGDDPGLRARLLARLAHAEVYGGHFDDGVRHATESLTAAEAAEDTDALIAALRAQQLALSHPRHHEERDVLARRMTALGQQQGRADVEMWGRLWAIDVLWERGDLARISTEISHLRWCVEEMGTPTARWHLLVSRAALAQARGEFDDALTTAREGFELMLRMGHPAAVGAFMSLAATVGHHRGQDAMTTTIAPDGVPPDTGELRNELFAHLGPATALADAGRLAEAHDAYRRPGPPASWQIPPYFHVQALHAGAAVAIALELPDDIAWFRERLEPSRGRHVAGAAGSANYFGPVELILGRCAAALGDVDPARSDLESALRTCALIGAPAFEVEAGVELAAVLARQGQRPAARTLLTRLRPVAVQLGMTPWVDRIDAAAPPDADPLTQREREVAVLVAQGKSNREIAQSLVLSERTASNHVQHILTKLGFANRSQIAAWVASNESRE